MTEIQPSKPVEAMVYAFAKGVHLDTLSLSLLQAEGYIVVSGGEFALTEKGMAVALDFSGEN